MDGVTPAKKGLSAYRCQDLHPKVKCFKVQRYNKGVFEEEFHEHVPAHRISREDATEAIRALVIRFANLPGTSILRSLLNKRGKNPQVGNLLNVHVEYPEPGVIRKVCGSDVIAWVDEVINEAQFRR